MLACGAGETNTAISKRMGLTGRTAGKWRKRSPEFCVEGLHDELRPGQPRTDEDDKVVKPTYASKLNQVKHWFGIITQRVIWRGSFSSVPVAGFRKTVGVDRQNRALHGHLQQSLSSFQLDCDCRFDPGEAATTFLANFLNFIVPSCKFPNHSLAPRPQRRVH